MARSRRIVHDGVRIPSTADWAGPLSSDFHHVPPNNASALTEKVRELGADRVCAIMLEPALGVAGLLLDAEYLQAAEGVCRENGVHLILDEVTTGAGRLGSMSYADQLGVRPDILILGKGLSSGYVPISALAATEAIYQAAISAWPKVVPHSSTNDAHPVAMAAGLAVLEVLREDDVFANVLLVGELIATRLKTWQSTLQGVQHVAGHGLMHFIHMGDDDGGWDEDAMLTLVEQCEGRGLLVDCINGQTVLTPPLITSPEEAEEMMAILGSAIEYTQGSANERRVAAPAS